MVTEWNTRVQWSVMPRIAPSICSLLLCLAVIVGQIPNAAFQEASRKTEPSAHYRTGGFAGRYGQPALLFPGSEGTGDPTPGPDDSLQHIVNTPLHADVYTIRFGADEGKGKASEFKRVATTSFEMPSPPRRSLRSADTSEMVHASVQSQKNRNAQSSANPEATLTQERNGLEAEDRTITLSSQLQEEKREITNALIPLKSSAQQHVVNTPAEEAEKELNEELERSASARMIVETPNRATPLAYSLLYRTRDITNPLTFANFLAEGQEWLIPAAGSLWEGLGRRVDSLFSGLFLRTASILPNYKRNVIICYKDYRPSMWIEMFGLRNQFLQQLASLFQGTHRMQSVYLRNLGMEIFEVPPLWRVREFIATVLKLKNFVSHVYTDQLVSDFDNEVQMPLPDHEAPPNKQQDETLSRSTEDLMEHSTATQTTAPNRRLEVMTNDPYTWQQWAIVDSGPSRWGIEAPNAWDVWTGEGLKPRFTVAVIDSGVDYEHPDLKNQIWRNPDEICGNGIDDDFNGFVDDCIGWDFVKGTNMPMDENGHGTASAGIIAAEPNNGIGLTGVCWGCDILVLKALNEEIKGTISAFARSLDYAIGKGIVLSNNSYGGRGSGFRGLQEAVERARQAGMIVVAAAGNYNGNNDNDKQPVFPASYDLDNVVAVAAISRDGQLAPFSSYGKKQVDVAAPGANIMTTSAKKSYRSVSGTSFAVPMVTGTLALLWTRRPHLHYRQVIQQLLRSVKKSPHLEGMIATGGTIDAWSALAKEDFLDPYAARPVLPVTCATASCSPYATCTDAQGTAKCVCNRGFEGDGMVCKDIDECIFNPCGPASVCVNTVGSYQCKCRKGFQQTQETCLDIDECNLGSLKLIPTPCPPQAQCHNFSGTFDCLCPFGTVWNGLSGPAAQCLRIKMYYIKCCGRCNVQFSDSPSHGPCTGNGRCGVNALCQAFFTPEPTRKCSCVSGFKPLRMSNRELGLAMASSQMTSFDNTVCIREEILPQEHAYYLITMHRERLRSLRQSAGTQTNAAISISPGVFVAPQTRPTTLPEPLNSSPTSNIPTPLTAGLTNGARIAVPSSPLHTVSFYGPPSLLTSLSVPKTEGHNSPPLTDKHRGIGSLARTSCLLGFCLN